VKIATLTVTIIVPNPGIEESFVKAMKVTVWRSISITYEDLGVWVWDWESMKEAKKVAKRRGISLEFRNARGYCIVI
jgi:hypothetical protein